MNGYIENLGSGILSGKSLLLGDAFKLSKISDDQELERLFGVANKIREHFRGYRIDLCSITNAKSGNCSQDCSFCSQSVHSNTGVPTYPLISFDEIISRAKKAYEVGTNRFCIVTSGCSVTDQDLDVICRAIKAIKYDLPQLKMDASLGELTNEMAVKLRDAGLDRYNHNIETSKNFFSKVCTTHKFQDRIETLKVLKGVGLQVCSGGIIGLGESIEDRIHLAFTLRQLNVDCVPINFLNPIDGTPLEGTDVPSAKELLKFVSIFRLILPDKEIRICGGREKNLGQTQSMLFYAGADSILTGDYLTTKGSQTDKDIQMIQDAGLKVELP